MTMPVEHRFKVLCEIVRAHHFAWRHAVPAFAPDLDPVELTDKVWQSTGVRRARAHLMRFDRKKLQVVQVAGSRAWSSVRMGEDGSVDETFVRHHDCP